MKTHRLFLFLLLCGCFQVAAYGQRINRLINEDWLFRMSYQVHMETPERVDLPHTWNAQDAPSGKADYRRGIGNYYKDLAIDSLWQNKRVYLRFDGANSVADLFVNGKHVGEHRGGYSAFVFEITDFVQFGTVNTIWVRVNNSEQLDVLPLVGDFTFYGGLYRGVHLVVADKTSISLVDYASPGLYLSQKKVTDELAQIAAEVKFSSSDAAVRDLKMNIVVNDSSKVVYTKSAKVTIPFGDTEWEQSFSIVKPHLWNGRKDPFMYHVTVSLLDGDKIIDSVTQPLGLRYYRVDPNEGFFLDGHHLNLHGVCRHQDRAERGNALLPIHHQQDVALMLEMGVNATRLAHYQQAEEMYDLMDENGIVTWAEIPFVGPGGYADKGFVDMASFKENGRNQLIELIRQNYNHPAICFWGLFNELKLSGDDPTSFVGELNSLAHQEDSTRKTTGASNTEGSINLITDVIAWNRYDGWYVGMPNDMGTYLDKQHKMYPNRSIAISEYGAGSSIYHHIEKLVKTSPVSWFHPEEWQLFYHMESWKIIHNRSFVWGSFIWNMFDFGAAHRTEGDRPGINDKGLVTFDRSVKKDVFYFYKANWNTAVNTLHLTSKRNTIRKNKLQNFLVISSMPIVELFVNGLSQGVKHIDDEHVVIWENVLLEPGKNHICARNVGDDSLEDTTTLTLEI